MAGTTHPPSSQGLAETVRAVLAGLSTPRELHDTFLASSVYCEAASTPGFVAVEAPPDGMIPIFSSELELVRARGPVAWFALKGADLLSLVPAGYDVVLDAAGDTPIRLKLDALRATGVIAVSQE